MDEFERIFGDEFFVIDSNNLNKVEDRLYGFSIKYDNIVKNDNLNDMDLDGSGAYVNIKVSNDNITISQDFLGSYGLYLYKFENYFAISNSFIKLVDYLKKNRKTITFNKEYADSFIFAGLCTFLYKETLVNQIEVIPRNYEIIISKSYKKLKYNEIDYQEHTVYIDTKKGMEILDKWYTKWINIIRFIKMKTNNIVVDLSGGFDTRVLAALWLSSDIDLNKINIRSNTGDVHVMQEDYRIASQIAKKFGFILNRNPYKPNYIPFEEINTPLNISFYTKLGFHKEMYFRYARYKEELYWFSGAGGETIRGYPNETYDEYIQDIISHVKKYDETLGDISNVKLNSSLNLLKNEFDVSDEYLDDLPEISYKEIRSRNHYGKAVVESYFFNTITLTPLIDPDLHKLKLNTEKCNDKHLLIALIYKRYCPDLLNFEFEGNRAIDKNTIEVATEINKKYPKIIEDNQFISGPKISNNVPEKINWDNFVKFDEANDLLSEVFNSRSFELEFKKYYPSNVYEEIKKFHDNMDFYHLKHVYAMVAILKIIYDTGFNIPKASINSSDWLKSFCINEINEKKVDFIDSLMKYMTSRIDIKNYGNSSNSINVIKSNDYNMKIYHENWFKDELGEGIIIESTKGILDLDLECINDGELILYLKSKDIKDKFNNRFPIYIQYNDFRINGKKINMENSLISHDKPFEFKMDVHNLEKINIHIEWMPFDESSEYKV